MAKLALSRPSRPWVTILVQVLVVSFILTGILMNYGTEIGIALGGQRVDGVGGGSGGGSSGGSGGGAASSLLIENNEWSRASLASLQQWKSTLFGRMAEFYKTEEAEASQNGDVPIGRVEPVGVKRYNLMDPFIKCPHGDLVRLGNTGDGGKLICVGPELKEPGCVIYSLGSNGDYSFEEAMIKETACDIFTFDCTFAGASLGPRHQYHKTCVGKGSTKPKVGTNMGLAGQQTDLEFKSYSDITKMLKHTKVDLLKIDIEGFEFDVFSDFQPACSLPMQISMEVHFNVLGYNNADAKNFNNLFWSKHDVSLGELSVFFFHLADMGYGIVSREDNIQWGAHCCSEFTLLRIEKALGCRRRHRHLKLS